MADLNVNTSESSNTTEDIGGNLVQKNPGFENAPAFTAATNTNHHWIDGTAAGSATNNAFNWAIGNLVGTASTQFDSSTSNSGSESMKLSTLAVNSLIEVAPITNTSGGANAGIFEVGFPVPVHPSTSYTCVGWMKTTANSGAATTGAYITWFEYTSAVGFVTQHDMTKVTTTTGWTKYTITFTTNATTAFILPQLRVHGNDGTATLIMDAWYDDLSITPNSLTNTGSVSALVFPVVTPGIQNVSGPKIWS